MFLKENINEFHCLYIRIHKTFISSKDFLPRANAFANTPKEGDNLSCDWCKYCSPESSRVLIGKQKKLDGTFKIFGDFFIWRLSVKAIKDKVTPKQIVEHDPIFNEPEIDGLPNNQAHSIIIGEKPNNAEFRATMVKYGTWVISPSS